MPRYIDADALIVRLLDYADVNRGNYWSAGFKNAVTVVETEETADVVERKKLTEEMRKNCVECALYKDDHECKACAWGDAINVIENALTEERERDDKSD